MTNTTTTCQGWQCSAPATTSRPDYECCDEHARIYDHAMKRKAQDDELRRAGIDIEAEGRAERRLEGRVS